MSHQTIQFYEHQFRAYDEIGFPTAADARDRLLTEMERVNTTNRREVFALERKGLRARELVGVVRVGNFTLEILPKIDSPASHYPSAARNLLAMFSYAADVPLHTPGEALLSEQPSSWFEILTRVFTRALHRQVGGGIPHSYIAQEGSLTSLRGRWATSRQAARPAGQSHRFEVDYDEFTPDLPLNQVFRYTLETLLPLVRDAETARLMRHLLNRFSQVTLLPEIPPSLLASITFHRGSEQFRQAFRLACLFLSGKALRLRAGRLPASALLFDMNVLFERFVAGFLERHRRQILPPGWPPVDIIAQAAGTRVYLAREAGENAFRLRPDLLFRRRGELHPFLIADTKYKMAASNSGEIGISHEDMYQALAYAIRFACPTVLLIYPQSTGLAMRRMYEIKGTHAKIFAASINLRTPLENPAPLIQEMRELFQEAG